SAGRFDLPGAVTATAGVASLVYGLSNAATTPDGVSHWGDTKGARVVGRRRGAARGVRGGGGPEQEPATPTPAPAQPGPGRGISDQLRHRQRADRHAVLPHPVRAGGVGL